MDCHANEAWVFDKKYARVNFTFLAYNSTTDIVAVMNKGRNNIYLLDAASGKKITKISLGIAFLSIDGIEFDEAKNLLLIVTDREDVLVVVTIDLRSRSKKISGGFFVPKKNCGAFPFTGPVSRSGYVPGRHLAEPSSKYLITIKRKSRLVEVVGFALPLQQISDLKRESVKVAVNVLPVCQEPWNGQLIPGGRFIVTDRHNPFLHAFHQSGEYIGRLLTNGTCNPFGVTFDTKRGRIIYSTNKSVCVLEANSCLPNTFTWTPQTHIYSSERLKKVAFTLALLRATQWNSAWSLMPNELLFLMIEVLA